MNNQDAFERILASLYDAMLDRERFIADCRMANEGQVIALRGISG